MSKNIYKYIVICHLIIIFKLYRLYLTLVSVSYLIPTTAALQLISAANRSAFNYPLMTIETFLFTSLKIGDFGDNLSEKWTFWGRRDRSLKRGRSTKKVTSGNHTTMSRMHPALKFNPTNTLYVCKCSAF
jgi:hypothetical protein